MSRSVNKVIFIGRVGNSPDIKILPMGKSVVNFSLATTTYFLKDNEKTEKTEWHRLFAFGKMAENISQFVKKGDQLYIEGSLQYSNWETENGEKRQTAQILISDFNLLGNKKNDNNKSTQIEQRPDNESFIDKKKRNTSVIIDDDYDDDIPF